MPKIHVFRSSDKRSGYTLAIKFYCGGYASFIYIRFNVYRVTGELE